MSPESQGESRPLTDEELDDLVGEPLPERAALSVVNTNLLIPVSPVVNLGGLAHDSPASAVGDPDAATDGTE